MLENIILKHINKSIYTIEIKLRNSWGHQGQLELNFVARIKSVIWLFCTFWNVLNQLRGFRVVEQLRVWYPINALKLEKVTKVEKRPKVWAFLQAPQALGT